MQQIAHLSEIRDRFDAVLIDQFGVLHDGHRAFPGAQDCMARLAADGVPVAALSNSGKRAHLNRDRLTRLGFASELFRGMVTSGELAHAEIATRLTRGRLATGAGVAIISRDGDASMIEGLDVVWVGANAMPDLLIIAAAEPETRSLEDYEAEIAPLVAAGVPALCINPDRQIYANGQAAFGPGMIAERYQALGGAVEMLGKPGASMFAAGLSSLGDPPPARTLMIGDSAEHDIQGGQAAGCQTLWITSGVQSGKDARADYCMARLTY